MSGLLNLLSQLTPEQQVILQSILAGFGVAVLLWIGRYIAPKWFANESNLAKIQKQALAVVIAGFAAIAMCTAVGGCATSQFILNWVVAWGSSQGAHNVAKRVCG